MKRLLLIAACLAFLTGCTKEDNVVRQKANLATKATQAHLNIQFMSFGNTLNFYIPEWDRYELTGWPSLFTMSISGREQNLRPFLTRPHGNMSHLKLS